MRKNHFERTKVRATALFVKLRKKTRRKWKITFERVNTSEKQLSGAMHSYKGKLA